MPRRGCRSRTGRRRTPTSTAWQRRCPLASPRDERGRPAGERGEDGGRGDAPGRHRHLPPLLRAAGERRDRDAPGVRHRAGRGGRRRSPSCPRRTAPLDQAVVLKLNGGLGTSMGMTQAKSLIEAKDGLTFLDVDRAPGRGAARARRAPTCRCVLMNSFRTRDDSLEALKAHPELETSVPAGLRAAQGAEAPRRRPDAGRVAGRPGAGVVPAGPRRPLHGAADLGDARRAARRRLPLRVHLQLRQPRRGARAARAGVDRRARRSRS